MNYWNKRVIQNIFEYLRERFDEMEEMPKCPLTVFEDDTFLVSYPKSGNTWMRFLIGTLYFREKMDWLSLNKFPDCYYPDEVLLRSPFPRILKSHELYDDRYQKVIYIVRDVREVVISYYYHHLRHVEGLQNLPFDQFFDYFMAGEVWPGLWDSHVQSWLAHRDKPQEGFLLLKYEDLKRDPFAEAKKITAFLNLNRSDSELKEAIEWSSFGNMRALEQKQWGNFNPDNPFVRHGGINTWQSFLTGEQQNEMNRSFGPTLRSLGYLE